MAGSQKIGSCGIRPLAKNAKIAKSEKESAQHQRSVALAEARVYLPCSGWVLAFARMTR
jgi:hypothetical protein